jgi:hypothetical protein
MKSITIIVDKDAAIIFVLLASEPPVGGWSAYFSHGALASVYRAVDDHVYDRVRNFLRRRHKAPGRGTARFSRENVYEELGVLRLCRGRERSPA